MGHIFFNCSPRERNSIRRAEIILSINCEDDINHFKKQALDNISDIASEFSKELIEKITGTKPNDSNLKAIISEISKKQKESRYV